MSIVRKTQAPVAVALIALLAACGQTQAVYPDKHPGDSGPAGYEQKQDSFLGADDFFIFGGPNSGKKSDESNGKGGGGIGINAYLWRASLDTIGFMPLASADPFGGVILTDWYAPPESPAERFKMSVFIVDRELHADGIHVTVFRQIRKNGTEWTDAAVNPKTATDMENAILTRARELRSAAASVKKD